MRGGAVFQFGNLHIGGRADHNDQVRRKRNAFSATPLLLHKKRSFYQDRLGTKTHLRKAHFKRPFFRNAQRRFLGHLALLTIYEDVITDAHATCLFDQGEDALPHPVRKRNAFLQPFYCLSDEENRSFTKTGSGQA
eukprot:COSAG06_NODE_19276_length_845_cov_1.650134_2_plen_136_part_00